MKEEQARRIAEVQGVLNHVSFPEYTFRIVFADDLAIFVQGEYYEEDTVTSKVELQKTRLWLVADTDTEDEIVRTLFKLVMTSMEHKAREWFKYDDVAVMNPHFKVRDYVKYIKEQS